MQTLRQEMDESSKNKQIEKNCNTLQVIHQRQTEVGMGQGQKPSRVLAEEITLLKTEQKKKSKPKTVLQQYDG